MLAEFHEMNNLFFIERSFEPKNIREQSWTPRVCIAMSPKRWIAPPSSHLRRAADFELFRTTMTRLVLLISIPA